MLILQAVGSNAAQLAMQAGDQAEIPVGWDSELQCATFDSDAHESEEQLQAVVF
jgi:hypothetical protein